MTTVVRFSDQTREEESTQKKVFFIGLFTSSQSGSSGGPIFEDKNGNRWEYDPGFMSGYRVSPTDGVALERLVYEGKKPKWIPHHETNEPLPPEEVDRLILEAQKANDEEAEKQRLEIIEAHKSHGDYTFGARTILNPQTFEEKVVHFLYKQITFGRRTNPEKEHELINLLQRFVFPTGNHHVDQATTLQFIDELLESIVTWQSDGPSNSDPGRRDIMSFAVSQYSNVELTAVNASKAYLENMRLKIKRLKKFLDLLSEQASASAMQRFHRSYENHLEEVRQQGLIANSNIPQLTDGTSTGQAPDAIKLNSSGLPKERIKVPVDLEKVMRRAIQKAKTKEVACHPAWPTERPREKVSSGRSSMRDPRWASTKPSE